MSSFKIKLQVGNLPSNRLALTNKIYISAENMQQVAGFYAKGNVPPLNSSRSKDACHLVLVNGRPYAVEGHPQVPNDQVALNGLQRRTAKLSLATTVTIQTYQPYPPTPLATLEISVDLLSKTSKPNPKAKPREVDTDSLAKTVLLVLEEQVLTVGQVMAIDFEGTKLELTVHELGAMDLKKKKKGEEEEASTTKAGQLLAPTDITFRRAEGSTAIALTGEHVSHGEGGGANSIFVGDFDFEKLGIGGLDAEFNQIFRRAFASRLWPSHIIKQMGINHVRGMLLYGAPGCGKVSECLSQCTFLL